MHQNISTTNVNPQTMPPLERLAWHIDDRGQQGIGCKALRVLEGGSSYYLENHSGRLGQDGVIVRVVGAGQYRCTEIDAVNWLRILGVLA